jgi:NADH-quinone oxidoreductase subunit H
MGLMLDLAILLLKIAVVTLGFALPLGGLLTLYGDRKLSALIQNRVGPNRARFPFLNHPLFYLPQFVADGIKMLFKEDSIPDNVNRFWHFVAPAVALFPAVVLWAVIPFGDLYCTGTVEVRNLTDVCVGGTLENYLSISNLDAGLLYVFAISSIAVYGAALAGWSSNSKFALLGGLRSTAQMISYEVTMGLSLAGMLIIYGTMNFNQMVVAQGSLLGGWLPAWGIVYQPVAFFLFLTAMMAETKRAPFDVPEGESEIVAGYFTEFSALKFGAIQLSEYVGTVFVGALVATIFLGGWQVPFLYGDGFRFGSEAAEPALALPYLAVVVLRALALVAKILFIVWLQFMVRWTMPRFRYDQIMALGWKFLLPLSLANLVVTGFVVLVLGGS